jgi:phytoene dehydrogenase-like protein
MMNYVSAADERNGFFAEEYVAALWTSLAMLLTTLSPQHPPLIAHSAVCDDHFARGLSTPHSKWSYHGAPCPTATEPSCFGLVGR